MRHAAITAALDETNGNVCAAREFSGHASIEMLMRYDNRKGEPPVTADCHSAAAR